MNNRINSKNPTAILIHGGNELAFNVAKSIIEQGGNVIVVDQYNSNSKKYITELKNLGKADFIDFKGLNDLYNKVTKLDYIFYFLHDYLHENTDFNSKDFLDETTHLNSTLSATKKFDAKLSVITSIKLNQDLTAHVLNKNLSAPSPYSPIELQKYCETLTAENRDKLRINARIIRVGTILGGSNISNSDSTVTRLIDESISKPDLTIYGEGLDVHYLINLTDAVYGVLKLTFSDSTEGEVVSLANDHDYTTLSLAYKLLELNPDLRQIKFLPASENNTIIFDQYVPALNATNYGWKQKVQLEQTLIQAIAVFDPSKSEKISQAPLKSLQAEKLKERLKNVTIERTTIGNTVNIFTSPIKFFGDWINRVVRREKENLSIGRFLKLSVYLALLLTALYYIFIPVTGVILSSSLLYNNSTKALNAVSSFDFQNANKYIAKAENNLGKGEIYLNRLEWVFDITKNEVVFENISSLIFASNYALSGANTLTKSLEPLANYARDFQPSLDIGNSIPSTSREYRIYLKELQTNLKGVERANYNISLASELLSKVDVSVFPKFSQQYLIDIKQANESIISSILPVQDILPFIPQMLGVDERQTYLILLQNPGEIRATGGWLSSYAIVSIEGGQIRELKVDDIYNAQGQLKIAGKTYDAPRDMQKALGITKWDMSLSNWNPDFESSSKNAIYFLNQLDPGSEFDAVISIDTEVVKKLLTKWGGITVAGESTPITAENLDAKIFELHRNFQPGESVKSTFLANLANETLKKVFTMDFNGYSEIADVLVSSLNEKHILVYFVDTDINEYFNNASWAGSLDEKYQWAPIPVEWNWGANKANLYLEKNHNLNINIESENLVNYEYTLYIKNNSISNIYPQGEYKNYLRIYLPRKAVLTGIKGFENDKYSTYFESGYKVVGGWYNVPIKSTRSMQIKYTLEKSVDDITFPIKRTENEYSMDLNIFKQPGIVSDIYVVSMTYPETWAAISHEGVNRAVNTLTARYNQTSDKQYLLIWENK